MKILIVAKNIKLTDSMKESINQKFKTLEKYFKKDIEIKTTVSYAKDDKKIEAIIDLSNNLLKAEAIDKDFYNAVDKIVQKLSKQLRKNKTKLMRNKNNDSIRFENIDTDFEVIDDNNIIERKKDLIVKPMSLDEAILQMDLLGHDFFVFLDETTFEHKILYRRKTSGYGLLNIIK